MKPSEARALSGADISREVDARKRELMELRFQGAVGQVANPNRIKQLRKEVARLLTIETEQRRAANPAAATGRRLTRRERQAVAAKAATARPAAK